MIHEHSCGDQHSIYTTLDRLLPSYRLRIIRDGECRLRDMAKQFGLGANICFAANGHRLLRFDPRWDDRRAQRLRDSLQQEGFYDDQEADADTRLTGLRHSGLWRLQIDLNQQQWSGLFAGWKVDGALCDGLERGLKVMLGQSSALKILPTSTELRPWPKPMNN